MEYSPPPLFKQGASARAKVVFFALISIALLLADARLHALTVIRQTVGTVLYPLQVAALLPRDAALFVSGYFVALSNLEYDNKQLKQQQILNAQTLQQARQLQVDNAQLRKLLGASEQVQVKSLMSEILYDARDAFTRKLVVDRGATHGVAPGQPVIDDIGVVGQVTRVFPFTSEITLLTDKDQAIPVQVIRSGLRSVAYGRGQSGLLDLRFMATNAEIQKGDELVTSGIDGVYPPGLSVAKVVRVETKSSDAFARIVCQPTAGIDRNRQLLILLVDTSLPLPPSPDDIQSQTHKKLDGDPKGVVPEAPPVAPVQNAPASGALPPASATKIPTPVATAPVTAIVTEKPPVAVVANPPSREGVNDAMKAGATNTTNVVMQTRPKPAVRGQTANNVAETAANGPVPPARAVPQTRVPAP